MKKMLNIIKNYRFEFYEWFLIQMFLQSISMPSCNNNNSTISKWPLRAAHIRGVELNGKFKFQKSLICLI